MSAGGGVVRCSEIIDAMWKPSQYDVVYIFSYIFTFMIATPHSITTQLSYPAQNLAKGEPSVPLSSLYCLSRAPACPCTGHRPPVERHAARTPAVSCIITIPRMVNDWVDVAQAPEKCDWGVLCGLQITCTA